MQMRKASSLPSGPVPPLRYWLPPLVAGIVLLLLGTQPHVELFLYLNGLSQALPDTFWSVATILGDSLVVLCLLLPLLHKRPDLALACVLAALPATLISHGLKDLVATMRPAEVLDHGLHVIGHVRGGYSFPSSHTTTAFVLAGVLAMGLRSAALAWAGIGIAMVVGLSRIAVGAHWPADILGGLLCGWGSAWLGLRMGKYLALDRRPRVITGVRLVLSLGTLVLLLSYKSGFPLARPYEQALAVILLVSAWAPILRQWQRARLLGGDQR